MEKVTDWVRLWRELVEVQPPRVWKKGRAGKKRTEAPKGAASIERRWVKPDSGWNFILSQLDANPDATVLDIGAGTGAWAVLLAQHARQVTAVEVLPVMIEALEENLAAEGITNVEIVRGAWPEVPVAPHDFTLCSHGIYGSPDLPAFIRRMVEVTRRTCFLVMRVPTADGVMAEAATHIWGQPYDSPNFQVAYNVLLQMGIYPNVLMEGTGIWRPWTNASLEEALDKVKRRFGLGESHEHDPFLMDLLRQRLNYEEGQYVWPAGARSALVYWDVAQ